MQNLPMDPTVQPQRAPVPEVSVIIPVRNGREYIHACLDSVLSQSLHSLEVVVVDDGSTDYDYQQLRQLDARVRVIRREGGGVSAARNVGMQNAMGNYLAFLDADDAWFPGKLQAQIRYFEAHPAVGCVFGGFTKWFAGHDGVFPDAATLMHDCSGVNTKEEARSGWLYTRLLTGLLVGMNTAVIRREVFDVLGGFDESMRIGEDYLFWLKVSRTYEMHALDSTVALYRIHPSSAMSRLDAENHQARLLEIAVGRWGLMNPDGTQLDLAVYQNRLGICEYTHGYNHFWNGSLSVARRAFYRAFKRGVLRGRSVGYIFASPFRSILKN